MGRKRDIQAKKEILVAKHDEKILMPMEPCPEVIAHKASVTQQMENEIRWCDLAMKRFQSILLTENAAAKIANRVKFKDKLSLNFDEREWDKHIDLINDMRLAAMSLGANIDSAVRNGFYDPDMSIGLDQRFSIQVEGDNE